MSGKFVVKKRESYYQAINTSIRMDKKIADAYEVISQKTGYSRNKLMCMALQFALKNIEYKENEPYLLLNFNSEKPKTK